MSESRKIRITLAQLNATVGDIAGNMEKMIETWKQYDSETDLVVFPELFLCGYPPEDLIFNEFFFRALENKVSEICEKTEILQSAALIPTPWRDEENTKINAFLLIQKGTIIAVQAKNILPNDTVFDEKRTFTAGPLPKPLEICGIKIGFLICEDMWFEAPSQNLKNLGAELLIVTNASPYFSGKTEKRKSMAAWRVKKTKLPLLYLNMVGSQDDLIFDGGSFILHPNAVGLDDHTIFDASSFEESIIQTTISFEKASATLDKEIIIFEDSKAKNYEDHLKSPKAWRSGYEPDYKAILLGVRDYAVKNGFSKVVLGLSGGIDSALVATMAVDALGAENVRCVMMPSEFTSKESLEDAEQCAKNLGIKYEILPIQDSVKTFEKIIPDLKGLAHENMQSRIRGLILMALSNISGELLLSTGNKSELATGYATLYGDMNGGFNPLKDVYKTEVYKLANHRNSISPVIPKRIIEKEPSAELRPNQTDQDILPPYNILDFILNFLIERDSNKFQPNLYDTLYSPPDLEDEDQEFNPEFSREQIEEWAELVAKLLRASEFKRRQSCPGPKITPRAFGKDRRYPITNKFLNRIDTGKKTS